MVISNDTLLRTVFDFPFLEISISEIFIYRYIFANGDEIFDETFVFHFTKSPKCIHIVRAYIIRSINGNFDRKHI